MIAMLMPKYDFKCIACGLVEEVTLSVEQSANAPACSKCGGETVRVYTPPAIQFKGPGFYKTGG